MLHCPEVSLQHGGQEVVKTTAASHCEGTCSPQQRATGKRALCSAALFQRLSPFHLPVKPLWEPAHHLRGLSSVTQMGLLE